MFKEYKNISINIDYDIEDVNIYAFLLNKKYYTSNHKDFIFFNNIIDINNIMLFKDRNNFEFHPQEAKEYNIILGMFSDKEKHINKEISILFSNTQKKKTNILLEKKIKITNSINEFLLISKIKENFSVIERTKNYIDKKFLINKYLKD